VRLHLAGNLLNKTQGLPVHRLPSPMSRRARNRIGAVWGLISLFASEPVSRLSVGRVCIRLWRRHGTTSPPPLGSARRLPAAFPSADSCSP
jgi:hypothetical protein